MRTHKKGTPRSLKLQGVPPVPQQDSIHTNKESPLIIVMWGDSLKKAATYSPALRCSTIGAPGLNFSVRDG
ncbi:MAG: hypothetical protein IJP82_03660, partial [Bacteroidaceae bacterium]|nr:hypothetical protein [Bacteroidaceae bacterium]